MKTAYTNDHFDLHTGNPDLQQIDIEEQLNESISDLVSFCLPHDFDRAELMKQFSKDYPSLVKPSIIPTAMTLLALSKRVTDHKEVFDRSADGVVFAEIHNSTLKSKVSNLSAELHPTIRCMAEIGWIEIDKPYKVKEKSKGYRIGERFRDSNWIEISWEQALEIHFPELFQLMPNGKISPLGKKQASYLRRWRRACSILSTWENMEPGPLKEVCVHTSRILPYLSIPNYDLLVQEIKRGRFWEDDDDHKCSEEDGIKSYLRTITAIPDKRFFVVCHDDRKKNHTNRLFTNWTSMKKAFRPFFRLKDRPLISVDIKACQVALLSSFYTDSIEDLAEKEKFVEVVAKHDIYLELAGRCATFTGNQISRKQAKKRSFSLMFGWYSAEDKGIREAFRDMFPVLYKRISEQKKLGHRTVARKMQLKEASIMIEGVLHELLVEKGIDCLSVHDSICCTDEHVKTVKDSITKWFSNEMGFAPQLEVEALEEPDLSSPTSLINSDSWWSDLKDSVAA
jgi:hypothetical protein